MLGDFDPDYARHSIIRDGLTQIGVDVVMRRLPRGASTLRGIPHAIRLFPRREQFDAVFIPAFNQLRAPLIWMLGRIFDKPVMLDYMVGLTDAQEDRQAVGSAKLAAFRWVDRFNTARMTCITDTAAHCSAFRRLLGTMKREMYVIPVGVKNELVDGVPPLAPDNRPDRVMVKFVGTYIPFHGVDIILQAADRLRRDARIRFELIGSGQTYQASVRLASQLDLPNVTFRRGFFHLPELLPMLADSTILLGVFGEGEKTRYVVPNKIYEGMALGRPMITAESPALSEYFTPGEHLVTIPPGDPAALAASIQWLAASPEEGRRIGTAAASRIRQAFLPQHIGVRLKTVLEKLCGGA